MLGTPIWSSVKNTKFPDGRLNKFEQEAITKTSNQALNTWGAGDQGENPVSQ